MTKGKKRRPVFANLPIRESLLGAQPEIRLWREVLDQALFDAIALDPQTEEDIQAKDDAIDWFDIEQDYQSFDDACFMAVIKPEIVRRVYGYFRHTN